MCLEISSMCLEIWIVQKYCTTFYPMTHKFADWSKFPVCVRKFTACVWKISDRHKLLECVRKFPASVQKLGSYKKIIFVFFDISQQTSRLLKVSGYVRKFWACVRKFLDFYKFLALVWKFFSMCPELEKKIMRIIFFLLNTTNDPKGRGTLQHNWTSKTNPWSLTSFFK